MKRNLDIRLCFLPLFLMMVALLPACKKDAQNGAPTITSVRAYKASPNDVQLSSNNPSTDSTLVGNGGFYVVIVGNNLKDVTEIDFEGVPASINTAFITETNAVVKIPSIQYSTIDTTKYYTLQYKTKGGSITYSFKLGPAAPVITAISNVFANPGDSVYIYGTNLFLIQGFSYAGTAIKSFKPSADGTSVGFLMPSGPPTGVVSLTTKAGKVIFNIVATPTITGVSNENAYTDDTVYVYGTYLKNIQSLTFAGTRVTSFTSSSDGSSVAFAQPTLTQSGPVSITTTFGTATTVYNVDDVADLSAIVNGEWLSNAENGSNWRFYGGANLVMGSSGSWITYNNQFPDNPGTFFFLNTNVLTPGEGNNYSSYAVLLNDAQWVPTANLSDPVDNWALKFEVSITKPWKGGTFIIQSGFGSYTALWQPWQITATKTAAYSTKGWMTVTIPLSAFRANDPTLGQGMGAPISQITDLVGASGNSKFFMYIHNFSAQPTATGFYGAFDNFRVVKVK